MSRIPRKNNLIKQRRACKAETQEESDRATAKHAGKQLSQQGRRRRSELKFVVVCGVDASILPACSDKYFNFRLENNHIKVSDYILT